MARQPSDAESLATRAGVRDETVASDPLRAELRLMWERLLARDVTIDAARRWADERLTTGTWSNEVTFRGLMLLMDVRGSGLLDAGQVARWFRVYWDWMEVCRQFDDDPTSWNRYFAIRFVDGLRGRALQQKALRRFVTDGYLSQDDAEEFRPEWFTADAG